MEKDKEQGKRVFWIGVLVGAGVVAVIFTIISRILIPLGISLSDLGVMIIIGLTSGGIAGFIARKGAISSARAGLLAAIIGATISSGMGSILNLFFPLDSIPTGLLLLGFLFGIFELSLYIAIPAIVGGMIGGALRHFKEPTTN